MMTGEATQATSPKAAAEYPKWIAQFDMLTETDHSSIAAAIKAMPAPPMVSVVMTGNGTVIGTGADRSRTIASLRAQIYENWEVLLPLASDTPDSDSHQIRSLPVSSFDGALRAARGSYVTFVEAGDVLPPHALATMILSLRDGPCFLYSDEDEIDVTGTRSNPHFKGGWNPDVILGQDFACRLALLRSEDTVGRGRGAPSRRSVYDLVLQVSAEIGAENIRHVPHVLYHRKQGQSLDAEEAQLMRKSLEAHVHAQPRGPGQPPPAVSSIAPGLHRVDWRLPVSPPAVSCIIPTRDRVELLRTCVEGLRLETDYPDLEIIIVDNESQAPETHAYFESASHDRRVRIIPSHGAFNFSALNNLGAAQSRGGMIALLNNDLKVMDRNWLRELVSHAQRPGVGAVGAMLWYEDDTVQHAGIGLGIGGIASHVHKRQKRGAAGDNNRLRLTQDVSAVTAACMVVPRAVWNEVGGMDEGLAVAYNDVDLCLRIRAAGHRILWTPFAELYHLESASRGKEDNPEKLARFNAEKNAMRARWGSFLQADPFYSPNLSLKSTDCRPAFPPRATFPWRSDVANHK
jgi:GT2 family glycosyltransferase